MRSSHLRARWGAEYADIYDVPDGHELCADNDDKFMNGIDLRNREHSFHPNSFGHRLIADSLEDQVATEPPADMNFEIHPGERREFPWDVPDDLVLGLNDSSDHAADFSFR